MTDNLADIFPACRAALSEREWLLVSAAGAVLESIESLSENLERLAVRGDLPPFTADLASVELALYRVRQAEAPPTGAIERLSVNPTLQILSCRHSGTLRLALGGQAAENTPLPSPGDEIVLVWRHPGTGQIRSRIAEPADLLALKVVLEELDRRAVAAEGGRPVGVVDEAVGRALRRGIILGPPSGLRRNPEDFPGSPIRDEEFLSSPVFTIQWHVTQACDLHCKHCYDRSSRSALPFERGIRILDDLRDFCLSHNVWGQVSFSGGNPLLYPRFPELYRAAADRGFATAILGNPAEAGQIDELVSIQMPVFYQISIEGLGDHNDEIRGKGHFDRAVAFLDVLRDRGVFSMVMLTLTRDNVDQVLPLAELLRGKADLFTFNRLAMVGEGANLQGPEPGRFQSFLEEYLSAAGGNPALRLKDNLINIIRHREGRTLFGGCAGHGCGAAFNFVSILPDGEVHACRKLPSPIGNIYRQSLAEVYDSTAAARYRRGSSACRSCPIRPVCGGCLAVVYGHGLDVFEDRDPYCFIDTPPT